MYNNLYIYPSATGCGLGQLNGNVYIPNDDSSLEEIKKKLIEEKNRLRYGAIIATIGDTHFKDETAKYSSILEKLGFKKILDYPNTNHGTDYKQHLYILL